MFTLSKASEDVKKILRITGMILAVIVMLFILFRILVIVKNIIFPTPPPKPTLTFGKLNQTPFPSNISNQNYKYNINTLTGFLPQASIIANIYRIKITKPDLLGASNLQTQASAIDFPAKYTVISNTILEWKTITGTLTKTFRGNTITGNFTITSPYLSDKTVMSGKNAPTQSQAISIASDMFSKMNLNLDDLDQNKTKTNIYSIRNNILISATSLSTTQVVEVDYYQKNINNLPIYYEKPDSSNISVFVAAGESAPQIVAATFIHQVPLNEFSTYPLKTTTQAFADLKQNKGYIASYDGSSNTISINNVYLAYYIGSTPQDFLLPIFVFTGNDNFYAYVSAVTDEWINK
jgi:hypothetical protein